MLKSSRSLIVLALVFLSAGAGQAQVKDDPFDFRRFLIPPRTTPEFWDAIKFEMEVGRFDLAAQHLRDMLAKNPKPEELVPLAEKEGIVVFLRLRLVPKWFPDKRDKEEQARKDVETLIDEVTKAIQAKLTDPKRIALFVGNLYGLPEEAGFARVELTKSGTAAVPYMIEELLRREEKDRGPILDALATLGHDVVRPLLAALDINDNVLRENLLDVIKQRRDLYLLRDKGIEVAPALWPLISPRAHLALGRQEGVRGQFLHTDQGGRIPRHALRQTSAANRFDVPPGPTGDAEPSHRQGLPGGNAGASARNPAPHRRGPAADAQSRRAERGAGSRPAR